MPRIAESELERLKTEIALQRLAEARGIELKAHGKDLLGLCPFHDDHEPSLVISPEKNLFHCLGCGAGGSVIDWVMQTEGVSFRHAVELLKDDHLPLAAGSVVRQSTVRKLSTPLDREADDQKLLNQVIDFYHDTLKQSPEALAYLDKRGLGSQEAIDRFKLGFANRTLGYRLPQANRKVGAALRGQLQQLGVLRASGHEHFNGSIVIPVFDDKGQVTEVYGRKINEHLRKGTPLHLYLPGPHAGVWNSEALKASKEIILCESLIDALTFWCAGFRNVTASYGVEGFTPDHLAAFKAQGTQRVLIAYDRDAAGDAAAEKLAEQLMESGIEAFRLQFPKGMDANAYACQVTPASKSLSVVIRSAQWLGKGNASAVTTSTANPEPVAEELATEAEEPAPLAALASAELSERSETTDVLPSSPLPDPPAAIDAEVKDQEIVMTFGDRRYRIRGMEKNLSYDQLKVNVLVSRDGPDGQPVIHVDTLDLYAARPRSGFIQQAACELGLQNDVIKADLGKLLLKLEALQDAQIKAALAPKDKTVAISDSDREEALRLLRSPDLLDRIVKDFDRCGVVGEETNKLVAYLACVSRKLESPLAVMLQSSSAAGKSSLMDATLALMPEEDRIQYSAMTGQSLFYMSEQDLKHKILAVAEEAGANEASYALKLLQSEGELAIASTGKDPATGKLVTQEYYVEGPVMIFSTTTAIDLDEELLNRCLILGVDENRAQTQAIHRLQRRRRTLSGLLAEQDKQTILARHRNAQRLLQPLAVINPYAERLTFLDDRTRTRRDHEKYLTLIDTIALLHQYQRPIQSVVHGDQTLRYVEVTLDDIATANRLAHEVLGRTLDELPPQTRQLLLILDDYVCTQTKALEVGRSEIRFSRRELRAHTGWSDTQLKVHLARLVDLEYLACYRDGRRQQFRYELLYHGEGQDGARFLMGLIDTEQLNHHDYDAEWSGLEALRSGSGRPAVGPRSGGGRGPKEPRNAKRGNGSGELDPQKPSEALLGTVQKDSSYAHGAGE